MATEDTPAGIGDADVSDTLAAIAEAYDRLEMPVRRYVLLILVPSTLFFFVTVAVAVVFPLPFVVALPIPLLGLLALIAAVIYPKLVLEQERKELESKLHLLITHMTVLSTTNIDRMEVFRTLAQEEEYGALAEEMHRIVQLVDAWNQSLDDACRRRAKEVPSKPLSDFLDRLAYSLGAGQELSDFLLSEQDVIIQNYVTVYQGALDNLEVMKDLYLSMILSMTFGLVFAVVLPILTGTNPTLTVSAVIVLVGFVQIGFYFAIRTVTPHDPLWYEAEEITPRSEPTIRRSLAAGGVLSMVMLVLTVGDIFGFSPIRFAWFVPGVSSIPMPIYAVIPITPLAIPGLVVRRIENEIKGRDGEFPSFIRALGASESAKQSTTSAVLKDLRTKDFGPLSPDVNNLYKRLKMRIEPAQAWRYFSADAQSYLIQKFSEMYLVGRQMGGDPKQLGELISDNMNEVLQLRERRTQGTITLIGLLYGITASSSFAFFIGLEVVELLSNMELNLDTSQFDFSGLINASVYDIPTIQFLLILVVLFNALLSSLMIRTTDGGHPVNAYLHFVVLAWIGAIIGVLTQVMVGAFLNV